MGKLSKQWQGARVNSTPSRLQVQRKIDESAAHCCLIVFTIDLMPTMSITLYIMIRFGATVHLLKHTHTELRLTTIPCMCDMSLNNTVIHLILQHPSFLSVLTDGASALSISCGHT